LKNEYLKESIVEQSYLFRQALKKQNKKLLRKGSNTFTKDIFEENKI